MSNEGKCRACGATILWTKTGTGRSIPLDPIPVEYGNLVLDADGNVGPLTAARPDDTRRYVSHFATCSNPDAFRRRRPPPKKEPERGGEPS